MDVSTGGGEGVAEARQIDLLVEMGRQTRV